MQTNSTKKPIYKKLLIIAVVVLLLGATYFFLRQPKKDQVPSFAPNATVGALPGKSEEEIKAILDQEINDKMVAFSINALPEFKNGKAAGNLLLESPANNINNIEFVIRRDDTGKIIYRSGLLKPNQYVEKDKLQTDKPLPKGTYPCTASITLFDPVTFQEKGMAQADIVITIKN